MYYTYFSKQKRGRMSKKKVTFTIDDDLHKRAVSAAREIGASENREMDFSKLVSEALREYMGRRGLKEKIGG
jgi:predicted HicB family RNase H-like nuclease